MGSARAARRQVPGRCAVVSARQECYRARLRRACTRCARASIILGATSALATDGSSAIVALARAHGAAAQLRFGEPCDAAPGATADLVLGSELLYYNTNLDALVATIADQLSEDGVCVLCVVHRIYGGAAALLRRASHGLLAFDMPANDDKMSSTRRACTSCAAPAA